MRALVVGADGFVGRHLVEHLRGAGDTVVEGVGPHGEDSGSRHPVDVRDSAAVERLIAVAEPDAVYHLAAVAYGPDASRDLSTAVAVTVGGTANVLASAARSASEPVVLVTGSSEVYGAPGVETIDEAAPTKPTNLYGATKVAQESIALAFGRVHETGVIVTRSFNHIGPGQRDSFAVASFAAQLWKMRAGAVDPVLRVGNLEPLRDFTDVRDVVRAYRLLVVGRHTGEPINVASGQGHQMREIVERLISISGMEITIEIDPERVRADDPPRIIGDASRLRELTGWEPAIPLEHTLRDIWDGLQETATPAD